MDDNNLQPAEAETSPPHREVAKPPMLFDQTQALVAELEEQLHGPFLSYWNGPDGSICQNDAVGMYEILRNMGRKDCIYLLVKSGGGNGQASLRLIHLLRQFTRRLVVLIPEECASAGTMLALGADEIQMGPVAYLTAVDTALRHDMAPVDRDNRRVSVSQDELARVINLWREKALGDSAAQNPYQYLFQYIHPLVIGAVDRSSSLSIMLCREILSYHMENSELRDRISRHLNSAYPSHGYPITLREAQRIGLKASELDGKVNQLLLRLNACYSEMGQAAVTDFDELNQHNNEILNIIESKGLQVYFQNDKDWHYRKEERRWVPLNDKSSWRRNERDGNEVRTSRFHIR